MAHYCPNCRVIFDKRRILCPVCDFDVRHDELPDSDYIAKGYRMMTRQQAAQHQELETPFKPVEIRDDDVLSQLRSDYDRQRRATTDKVAPEPAPAPQKPEPAVTKAPDNQGFFGQFTGVSTPEPEPLPPVEPMPEPEPITPQTDAPQRYRGSGWHSFLNFMYMVPWRTVFRVLLILAAIWGVVTIWNMRFVILDAILEFIFALLPTVLLIGAIVWLIRSLFKGGR